MIAAIVPAAGESRRMGRQKLALPIGHRTVLEHVVETLRSAGVNPVIVVLGPATEHLNGSVARVGGDVCLAPAQTPDMRATVEFGLRYFSDKYEPGMDDAWFLLPADFPAISSATIQRLIVRWARRQDQSIWAPVRHSRRGHPVLFSWRHARGIQSFTPGVGINVYVAEHSSQVEEVMVSDEGIGVDVDTPADWQNWLRHNSTAAIDEHQDNAADERDERQETA